MHSHDHCGLFINCLLVVRKVCSVCCSHFAQATTGAFHDIWDSERPSNFNQLSSRNDDVLAFRKRIKNQHYRCCIIVDHRRCLSSGQVSKQLFKVCISVTSAARLQIIFDIDITQGSDFHGRNRFDGQPGSPQIGMDHRAREIENCF